MCGHVGPEAALGGPLALTYGMETLIDIDAKKGTINVRLTKSQLATRRKQWKAKKSSFGSGTIWEICPNSWAGLSRCTYTSGQEEKKLKNTLKFNED